jgi:hypothetical protein
MTLTAYESVRLLAGFAMVLLILPAALPSLSRWRQQIRLAGLAAFLAAMAVALYVWLTE